MIDEGYIKFVSDWCRSDLPACDEIDALLQARRPLFAAGLVGYDREASVGFGNLSARLGQTTQFVISGTQTGHIEDARREHFALVTAYDIGGNTVSSSGAVEASSESLTHAALYELDLSIGAVVHVHSDDLWYEFKGALPTTSPAIRYGTPEMAREFQRLFADTVFARDGVAVMAGHDGGLISIGRNPQQAASKVLELQASTAARERNA